MQASVYARFEDLPWRETPHAGVQWKKLHFDATSGRSAVLLRFAPGASYGTHRHGGVEQYTVLEGELEDGGERWGPGSYVLHPRGSVHRPSSSTGCTLLVVLDAPIEPLE